jgi:hypothetical protein
MTSSKFTQSLLVVVALLLTWLAIRPNLPVPVVHAAGPVQYKVVSLFVGPGQQNNAWREQQLNALGNDGWTLIQCDGPSLQCDFKR